MNAPVLPLLRYKKLHIGITAPFIVIDTGHLIQVESDQKGLFISSTNRMATPAFRRPRLLADDREIITPDG